MVKVIKPLFSDSAHGRFADVGSFRRGKHGPEFIRQASGKQGDQPPTQQARKQAFKAAKAAHALSAEVWRKGGKGWGYYKVVGWGAFWRQWLVDHPVEQP